MAPHPHAHHGHAHNAGLASTRQAPYYCAWVCASAFIAQTECAHGNCRAPFPCATRHSRHCVCVAHVLFALTMLLTWSLPCTCTCQALLVGPMRASAPVIYGAHNQPPQGCSTALYDSKHQVRYGGGLNLAEPAMYGMGHRLCHVTLDLVGLQLFVGCAAACVRLLVYYGMGLVLLRAGISKALR